MDGPDAPDAPDAMLAASRQVEVGAGTVVFAQDDAGDTAYVVVEGRLKISQHARGGLSNTLAILGPGDMFGELSLFDAGPRSASAQALTDVTLRALDRVVLGELVEDDPDVAAWLIRQLAQRLRRATDTASQLVFSDVPARTAAVLLDLAEQFGVSDQGGSVVVDHGLTQAELAQLAGATRETVNKALSTFAARGWITVSKGSTRISDPQALGHRAGREPEPVWGASASVRTRTGSPPNG